MHNQRTIRLRLLSLKIPLNDINRLLTDIQMWKSKNGEEWVVLRFKTLKTFFLTLMADPGLLPKDVKLPFFKKDKSGLPRGSFSFYSRLYLSGNYDRLLRSLQVHTSFVATTITEKQFDKFHSSIKADSSYDTNHENWLFSIDVLSLWEKWTTKNLDKIKRIENYEYSPYKRVLNPLTLKSCPETDLAANLSFIQTPFYFKHSGYDQMSKNLSARIGSILRSVTDLPVKSYLRPDPSRDFVGTISFIQEPGYKLRAIANPARIYQVALQHFGDQLWDFLKKIPQDCTYDQEKGVRIVQENLNAGKNCHAVDLSDATNYFPLEYTYRVIKGSTVQTANYSPSNDLAYLELWKLLCRANWLVDKKFLLNWSKGQPLGLYPSFPAFALSHHHLVQSLYSFLYPGRSLKHAPYVLLGDDIVIFDDALHDFYRESLLKLGCPISVSKCISSNVISEFAGRVIHKDDLFILGKWRTINDDNFVDIARSLGRLSLTIFPKKYRKILKLISWLPEPVGFGWNPEGLPLSVRLNENILHLYEDKWSFRSTRTVKSFSDLMRCVLENTHLFMNIRKGNGCYPSIEKTESIVKLLSTTVDNLKPTSEYKLKLSNNIVCLLSGFPSLGDKDLVPYLDSIPPDHFFDYHKWKLERNKFHSDSGIYSLYHRLKALIKDIK